MTLDAMNNLELWMTLATLDLKLKALNAMNNSRLWLSNVSCHYKTILL